MKKASLIASAAVASLIYGTAPVFAQAGGPFADVPTDHWAYSSVDKLQKAGIVIGYPDLTYGGKRAMTRYEFAVAIARLLDKIPPPSAPIDLSPYALKTDLTPYALKTDLDAYATKESVAEIRKLVDGFADQLRQLGVDVADAKRRLDSLEGRVKAIETELKRVQISGAYNFMARGNNIGGSGTVNGVRGFVDNDGYFIGGTDGTRSSLLADARVFHDIDLNIKARLSDTATAVASLNFGNYLPFLNSIGSYSGVRSARGIVNSNAGFGGDVVNQSQEQTVYLAYVEAPARLFKGTGLSVTAGRLPIQFTPYTLKLIDTDAYFYNNKTDLGDIPVDGAKVRFNLGPVSATAFGAKVDPIKYLSDSTVSGGYGLYAGSGKAAYGAATIGQLGGIAYGNTGFAARPVQSSIRPGLGVNSNGAMAIEQMAGVRATVGTSFLGTLGATYLVASGRSNVTADLGDYAGFADPNAALATALNSNLNFDRVFVYGGDINTHLGSVGIVGSYTKTDTQGTTANVSGVNNLVTGIDTESEDKRTEDNYAWDAAATFARGNLSLKGGYREVAPYFAAPGYWDKVGSYTNPTDIKGAYVKGQYNFSNALAFSAEGKFYKGTGKAENEGGLRTDDKITNFRIGLKYGLTSASGVDAGIERTEYKIGFTDDTPVEYFYNIGYGYSFNPATSFKVLYQIVDYRDKNSGFDSLSSHGGVLAGQFSVKF